MRKDSKSSDSGRAVGALQQDLLPGARDPEHEEQTTLWRIHVQGSIRLREQNCVPSGHLGRSLRFFILMFCSATEKAHFHDPPSPLESFRFRQRREAGHVLSSWHDQLDAISCHADSLVHLNSGQTLFSPLRQESSAVPQGRFSKSALLERSPAAGGCTTHSNQ